MTTAISSQENSTFRNGLYGYAYSVMAAEDIVIANFESKSFGGWIADIYVCSTEGAVEQEIHLVTTLLRRNQNI